MSIINVNTISKTYPIYIEQSFYSLANAFENVGLMDRKVVIVSDDVVSPLYLDNVIHSIGLTNSNISHFVFPHGEASKNLKTISDIYDAFVAMKLDRKSVVVALGGGVVGDMAGFAAATYMRGIRFVQIPTSLLAQVDSSVGGKTGVDFGLHKNLVGAFYQPEFVYINTATLNTLAKGEFVSGLGEVIKHGLIRDKNYLAYIAENKEKIMQLDPSVMSNIIQLSCKIKAEIVSMDETEQGIREILNFGHTFGHAVESLSNFTIPHGKCVTIGMVAALYISKNLNQVSEEEFNRCMELFTYFGLPTFVCDYCADEVYKQMTMDKKAKNAEITYILLYGIGNAYATTQVSKKMVMDAMSQIIKN